MLKPPRAGNDSPTPSPLSSFPGGMGTSTDIAEDISGPLLVKEKRKRTRVTPEQLEQLEGFFLSNRCPTAVRRKEISDLLGMKERQTQVWFQNRRAKAKHSEGGKHLAKANVPDKQNNLKELSPPLPELAHNAELKNMLHESEDLTVIQCSEVTVGTWTRLASQANRWDLVTYVCNTQHRVSYFIHAAGCSVKMDIPYGTIVDIKPVPASAETAHASFFLSRAPLFFLEEVHATPAPGGGKSSRKWVGCADWTEDLQASSVLRHDMIGPASALSYLWQSISAYRSRSQTPHFVSPSSTSGSPALPTPPASAIQGHAIQGRDHRPPQFDYLDVPLLQTHATPFLRTYSPTVQDIRSIDTTAPRFSNQFALPVSQSQISPTASSPTFSDVSGSVSDSPQIVFSSSSLESSPEFQWRNSLPPLMMRQGFPHGPFSQSAEQGQFIRPAKYEVQNEPLSLYSGVGSLGRSVSFWPSG